MSPRESEQSDGMDLDRAEHLLIHGMTARERDGLIRWLRDLSRRAAIADMVEGLAADNDEVVVEKAERFKAEWRWCIQADGDNYHGPDLHSALAAAWEAKKGKA